MVGVLRRPHRHAIIRSGMLVRPRAAAAGHMRPSSSELRALLYMHGGAVENYYSHQKVTVSAV